ncbi:DUF4157 domain-containing protein [Kordia sp.]|uniref:eCIS core domain-containing protein n=1 Tax=Kordia sp. TaxID=1965332 RepID=UPI0025BC6410|nr:DUF4157 domain-containing protein [Kordia sp.]MCH2193469.1 DUF4157 domain-containing protein [Kordia sp.]
MEHQHNNKTKEKTQQTVATYLNTASDKKSGLSLEDNRASSSIQQKQVDKIQETTIQKKKNNTGLPNNLKSGIESLSRHSMDDVKVHYNSSKPAQLNAHAYAQGTNIHIASGQEKHLPHEAWHVVQQKQGRVQATKTVNGSKINDNVSLEKEADVMGAKALQLKSSGVNNDSITTKKKINNSFIKKNVAQRNVIVHGKKGRVEELKPKDEEINGNIVTPLERLFGGEGVHLLKLMIKSKNTYEFQNINELHEAIGAQTIINASKRKGKSSDELTEHLLSESKDSDGVDALGPREQGAASMAASFQLAHKYGVKFFGRPTAVKSWAKNAIVQTTQQRGDKSHVLAAMHVDPTLQLVLCFDGNFKMASEGDGILETYSQLHNRVCVYQGSPNRVSGGTIRNLTYSTAILKHAAIADPLGTRKKVQHAMTGKLDSKTMEYYEQWSQDLGFVKSHKNKYVIISHRDSGHKVPKGRTPSHPELDTGEYGFMDMILAVERMGFIPVPMGAPALSYKKQPNMIKWWMKTPKGLKSMGKTKGQIEYGMVRFLAEQYGVRLLAMRSGNTDAMAFAGMETIFIDMATEGLDPDEVAGAKLTGKEHEAHNRSWRRAAMLETVVPGVFHQIFLQHPRLDKAFPDQDQEWNGSFAPSDVRLLEHALEFYFGKLGAEVYNRTERHLSSPIDPKNTADFSDRVDGKKTVEERQKRGYESIADFVKEVREERQQQVHAPTGKLNEIFLKLENIRTRLTVLSADIEKLKIQLEQLKRDVALLK